MREPEPNGPSVVIPAYEESANLVWLIPAVEEAMASSEYQPGEILVVLPSFADEAEVELVESLGARAVVRGPSDSFGDAIRSGLAAVASSSRFVILMDADGSHSPSSLSKLLAAPEHLHVVVASRYTQGGSTDNSLTLRLMSRALNLGYGLILGVDCRDVSTNFKRYQASDLRRVRLMGRDFDVVEEMIFRIRRLHGKDFTIVEIPDHFAERRAGVTKRRLGPFIVSYLVSMARLRLQIARRR